jgi:IS30 family transposase
MSSIHTRPSAVQYRMKRGHWGKATHQRVGNKSPVGVLVERTSRLVLLGRRTPRCSSFATSQSADSAKRRSDISHVHVGHTKTKWFLLLAALHLAVKATPTTTNQ